MKEQTALMPENFNDLLDWFSANRETAGEKYEEIRKGLIRFFYFKGCADAETLADETFNRVASKLPVLDLSKNSKPVNLFYGFASKIYLEYASGLKKREVEFNADLHNPIVTEDPSAESVDKNYECLRKCLAELKIEESNLMIEYYSAEKSEKIECRKKLAEKMKMKTGALQVKVYRLRNILRKCVEKCAAQK